VATLKGKKVVVTGGAGFIGSHLVDQIIQKEPAALTVIDNFFLGSRKNLDQAQKSFPKLEIIDLDATDLPKLREVFKTRSVDVVFDLATIPLPASLERPLWSSKVIYDLTLNLCELCREGLFKTLIHCSSSEAYGSAEYVPMDEEHSFKTETPYAAAKASAALLVESYKRTFGIEMAIGRPFNNYGPRQNGRDFSGIIPRIIQRIMKGETPIIFGDGKQTRDYLYVTDTARGLVMLYENEDARGMSMNLASGKELTVIDLIQSVCHHMGWKKSPQFAEPRPGDVRRHCAAVERAQQVLKFTPQMPWEEGIEKTVRWYQANQDRLL
jgi:UDP-glucose 4-epimerase